MLSWRFPLHLVYAGHVPAQDGVVVERAAADLTLEGLLTGVYPGVAKKALLLGENLLAYGTIEALVSGVDVTVDSQRASQPECLTAVLAGKALRGVRVQALVGFQRALMTEGLFADGAFIGFSIGVNQLVFCEGMLGCEGLPTSWAGV